IPGGWIWVIIIAGVVLIFLLADQLGPNDKIEYGVFKQQLLTNNVEDVHIYSTRITGKFKNPSEQGLPDDVRERKLTKFSAQRPTPPESDRELYPQLDEHHVKYDNEKEASPWLGQLLLYVVLPFALIFGFFYFFFFSRLRDPLGGSFLSNYIKSPAKRYEK